MRVSMRAISATKKLTDLDHVNVIYSAVSGISKVISPIATQKNILHIGIAFDANLEGNLTSFSVMSSPKNQVEKYVQYLIAFCDRLYYTVIDRLIALDDFSSL